MKDLFTSLNTAVAGAATPIACNHNHALVHNPFAWRGPKQDAQPPVETKEVRPNG